MTHSVTQRLSTVYSNGTTDKIDLQDYDQANALFQSLGSRDDVLYVAWLELGFDGTSDAQWVVVNQGARYAG